MEEKKTKTTDREYYLFALKIFGDFGITIALPAVLGAWAGGWLDEKYQKFPLFTIIFLIIAFLATIKIIRKKAKKYGALYQNMIDAEKNIINKQYK